MGKMNLMGAVLLGLAPFAVHAAVTNPDYNALGTAYRIASETSLPNSFPYTSTSSVTTGTNQNDTYVARVVCTTDCNVLPVPNVTTPTATASSTLLPAYVPEYFVIEPKSNMAVRGATAGSINITKMKR